MIARSAGDPVAGEPAPGTSPLPLAARLPAGDPLGALERIAAGPVHPAVLELPAVDPGPWAELAAAAREVLPGTLLAVRAQEDPTAGDPTGAGLAAGAALLPSVAALLPSAAALGTVDDVDATRGLGDALGDLLAGLGIDVLLGPVLHVAGGPDPLVGTAAVGRDGDLVARHGRALAAGVRDAGIAACGLALPGLGGIPWADAAGDRPGEGVPLTGAQWRDHLLPWAIAPWLDAVLAAPVAASALGEGTAALAPWPLRLLEESAHAPFHGLLVAGDLGVAAARDGFDLPAAVLAAARAGAHVLHVGDPSALAPAAAALREAERTGELPPELLAQRTGAAAERLAALRARRRWLPTPDPAAAAAVLAARSSALALRAVRARRAALDLRPVAVVDLCDQAGAAALVEALRARHLQAESPLYAADLEAAPQLLALTGRGMRDPGETERLRALLGARPDAIVVHTGPRESLPEAERTVSTLGASRTMLDAAVAALLGDRPA